LIPPPQYVIFDGAILPPRTMRWCGAPLQDDSRYVASAEAALEKLQREAGLSEGHCLVDIGCGQGRLAIAVLRKRLSVNYVGLDIHGPSIAWCRQYLEPQGANTRFIQIDCYNERYNPAGTPLRAGYRFPLPEQSADVANLYSVFSHLTEEDAGVYLEAIAALLKKGGTVFLTAFTENNVPAYSINPPGYVFAEICGPLHVVRYEASHFEGMLVRCGLDPKSIDHGVELDGQTAIIAKRL
jgi:cyclopropane fatty-acyl-phospholipid synthase-like methyltransferase